MAAVSSAAWRRWPSSESDLIAERTRADPAAINARGRMGGRPLNLDVALLPTAMHAAADRDTNSHDRPFMLGINATTKRIHVNGGGRGEGQG